MYVCAHICVCRHVCVMHVCAHTCTQNNVWVMQRELISLPTKLFLTLFWVLILP